ncbi:MAG: trypsin-like peptidase domain-containing protein [Alphaproteobacteria bacterium]|nr:trypsin-like peptidase domain-containing protein [Alphaproteobacteria bacterium]
MVLLFLLIPGVLRYPGTEGARALPVATPHQEINSALEERIATLQGLLDGGICVRDGTYALPGDDSSPGPELAALPPALAQSPAGPEALPEGSEFAGSLLDLIDQATTLVLVAGPQGESGGMGTGFFVTSDTILTNRHVVDIPPGGKIFVVNPGIGVKEASIAAQSATDTPGTADFALLRLATPAASVTPLSLVTTRATRLTNVVAAGFPGMVLDTDARFRSLLNGESGELPTAVTTEGVITATQAGSGTEIILHTAQISPGNSGGPLLDRCGRVLGINTFIRTQDEGRMNYALAAQDLHRFLTAAGVTATAAAETCPPAAEGTPSPAPSDPTAPAAAK